MFVELETLDFEAVANTVAAESGSAGIRAAELVIEHGTEAIITGNGGPDAKRM